MSGTEKILARDITWREIRDRIKKGRDIAVLPVGSMEMHGPQLPLGTDTFVAEAVSIMAARKMQATVFDTVSYTWPGCTKYSQGTISITLDLEKLYLRAICNELARNGFRRIYVVQFHGPGFACRELAREFLEEQGIPLVFFGLCYMPSCCSTEELTKKGKAWEASLLAAAADYLGVSPIIDAKRHDGRKRAPEVPGADARYRIGKAGGFMGGIITHELHHGVFTEPIDKELGMTVLKKMADSISSTAEPMKEYRDQLARVNIRDSWKGDK